MGGPEDSRVPVAVKPASASDGVELLLEPTGPYPPAHRWLSAVRSSALKGGDSVRHFSLATPSLQVNGEDPCRAAEAVRANEMNV